MPFSHRFEAVEPTRAEVDSMPGCTVLEFGTPWCGFCQSSQPLIESELSKMPSVRHLKIEDGRGKRLGRSFRVKLWPTLIVLANGREVARVVRPEQSSALADALAAGIST